MTRIANGAIYLCGHFNQRAVNSTILFVFDMSLSTRTFANPLGLIKFSNLMYDVTRPLYNWNTLVVSTHYMVSCIQELLYIYINLHDRSPCFPVTSFPLLTCDMQSRPLGYMFVCVLHCQFIYVHVNVNSVQHPYSPLHTSLVVDKLSDNQGIIQWHAYTFIYLVLVWGWQNSYVCSSVQMGNHLVESSYEQ